ncbi:LpxL/LpxP family Kdo(2)-lipid IV(A) lauroyl/palmitoleoyl acyltransferase [Oceanospirillum linum]|uniref:Lipid A biosynthesis acyltransferase n=1 Tax=Oceanospirillum linum TaxID=966 RepID=A0A1T1HBZ0_OCELI|nr:LpxL/LpxP family Kdo(2)-lipid IV(A) lauroyl/palmitoleoyl acyltransferase [Oceanospirillum linum]OOV87270.1 lipid A biosynthesis acyltransferase [Oceanospirillum linum]SEF79578.1 KDO2-lipid IV(A) lauroyltransferase [Oleiphilus messinensis]SMP18525.1 KDO2-lipid IV(A) lauroyltransferase [Oceanospirillum linum]
MAKKNYPESFWHPRYWPTWTGFFFIWLAAFMPWPVKRGLGRLLGYLLWFLAKRRRHITEVNIALCFPELTPSEQKQRVKDIFIANGIGLLETATAWFRDPEYLRPSTRLKGGEHLQNALAQGKGAIIIGIHFSTLDLAGAINKLGFDIDAFYRKHSNPVFEWIMTRSRKRIYGAAIDRHDLKGALKRIKSGRAIWYSPDQDFGRKVSVFAPFFGIEAASIKMTARLAKMTGCAVVPLAVRRLKDNSYELEYFPALDNFPSGDDIADATRINRIIEGIIRQHPEQYMWMHRRFKTRPEGEKSFY